MSKRSLLAAIQLLVQLLRLAVCDGNVNEMVQHRHLQLPAFFPWGIVANQFIWRVNYPHEASNFFCSCRNWNIQQLVQTVGFAYSFHNVPWVCSVQSGAHISLSDWTYWSLWRFHRQRINFGVWDTNSCVPVGSTPHVKGAGRVVVWYKKYQSKCDIQIPRTSFWPATSQLQMKVCYYLPCWTSLYKCWNPLCSHYYHTTLKALFPTLLAYFWCTASDWFWLWWLPYAQPQKGFWQATRKLSNRGCILWQP